MTETNTVWLPSLEQELTRHLLECSYDMHTFWVPPLEDFFWGFPFKAHTSTRLKDGEASKRIFKNGRHLWRSGAWVSTVHNDCVLRAQQSPADHMVHSKMFLALHLLSDCACFFNQPERLSFAPWGRILLSRGQLGLLKEHPDKSHTLFLCPS